MDSKNLNHTDQEWYADVILPLAVPVMTFVVPDEMRAQVKTGHRVIVPVGERKFYTGIVDRVHQDVPDFGRIKPIERIIDLTETVTPEQLRLWHWLSSYYMAPLGLVMRAALPTELKSTGYSGHEVVQSGYIPQQESYIRLHPSIQTHDELTEKMDSLSRARRQQKTLMDFIDRIKAYDRLPSDVGLPRRMISVSDGVLEALIEKKIFQRYPATRMSDDPDRPSPVLPAEQLPVLSSAQQEAFLAIEKHFDTKEVVLLHGVTGSGKTEIYIRWIDRVLRQGGSVLYLLPEIALTEPLIERLKSYFGDSVIVYHSRLNNHLRATLCQRLSRSRGGHLIVGVRSAVLLPLPGLKLVVVDEEHDSSFKQTDTAPRYHGRDAAIVLASFCGAKTLLGSATPCAESYYNGLTGKYGLVSLCERYSGVMLPQVVLSDRLCAMKRGEKYSHFNKFLLDKIEETLAEHHQVILFQNRRGFSPYVECGHCGWTAYCPNCNVSLTYHKQDQALHCHYCGYRIPQPECCPSCGKGALLPRGFGTEKIEEELSKWFPDAVIERLDADTARSVRNYQRIIHSFARGHADILVGTQIVSKGFDFESVTLVGILNADNMLNYPDFRAGERAFQMMMQVGGRAGRRQQQGMVIIQTAQPNHPVIRQVLNSDYQTMIHAQLAERREFLYPPFCRLILVVMRHKDHGLLWRAAAVFGHMGREIFGNRLLGPEPPPVDRVRGEYRLQFLLKTERQRSVTTVKQELTVLFERLRQVVAFKPVSIVADVDPQ